MTLFILQPPEPFNFDKLETWKFGLNALNIIALLQNYPKNLKNIRSIS